MIVGTTFEQGVDYLEHFTAGACFGGLRMLAIIGKAKRWIMRKADVVNAFPHETVEGDVFMRLPKGPFDWKDPVTGEEQVGKLVKNLYGTPFAPRRFTKGAYAHHIENGFSTPEVDHAFYAIDNDVGSMIVGEYVDEFFYYVSNDAMGDWYESFLKRKYEITKSKTWSPMLGFEVDDSKPDEVQFGATKYVRGMVDQFLKGESQPARKTASRKTIGSLLKRFVIRGTCCTSFVLCASGGNLICRCA